MNDNVLYHSHTTPAPDLRKITSVRFPTDTGGFTDFQKFLTFCGA